MHTEASTSHKTQHTFVVRAEVQEGGSAALVSRKIGDALAQLPDIACEVRAVGGEVDTATHYHDRLNLLSKLATASLHDGSDIPMGGHPQFARIQRFLVPLPERYSSLKLEQDLVRVAYKSALEGSGSPDGALLHAFERYRALYEQAYLAHLAAFDTSAQALQKELPELLHLLFVVRQLDALPALGAAVAQPLADRLATIADRYQPIAMPLAERKRVLLFEPLIRGISLFTPLPEEESDPLSEEVAHALAAKLKKLTEESVLALLRGSRDPTMKKLLELVQLTHLGKVAKLFTEKTAPKIIAQLSLLLAVPAEGVAQSDFMPRTTTIASSKDAKKAAKEYEEFLLAQLAERGSFTLTA